jgi:hypothetical protein
MGLPAVSISKSAFSTSLTPGSSVPVGILAILAASSTGSTATAGGYSRSDTAITAFGYGPLTEYGAYDINVANQPVVLVKGNATFAGSYSSFSTGTSTGTSTVTTSASAGNPFDHYNVQIKWIQGGTVGVSGMTYTYSVDGGTTVSGLQAQGTSSTLSIPNTGVAFALGAGTIGTGDAWTVNTERPLLNDTDVVNGLNILGNSRTPWEGVLIDSSCSSATVGLVDTVLSGWEGRGIFKFAILNTRYKLEPEPTAETEAAYAAALTTTFGSQTSIRISVGADGAHVPSAITGFNLKRPTSLLLAARSMAIPIGEDAAYVARGAIVGAQIADGNGNPFDHDEDLFPNLDALRLASLRSFAPGGPQGVYMTNPNVIQPSGGQFPYLQLVRVANVACTIAWATLTTQLSRGVRKNPKADPVTGAVYIFEPDAAVIDALVNDALIQPLKGQVTSFQFSLSRTDNLNATPTIVTGLLDIVSEAYIKGYQVTFTFSKTLQTAV